MSQYGRLASKGFDTPAPCSGQAALQVAALGRAFVVLTKAKDACLDNFVAPHLICE